MVAIPYPLAMSGELAFILPPSVARALHCAPKASPLETFPFCSKTSFHVHIIYSVKLVKEKNRKGIVKFSSFIYKKESQCDRTPASIGGGFLLQRELHNSS